MDFLKEAEALKEETIRIRRYFHENPDVTGLEEPTTLWIKDYLDSLGIETDFVKDGGLFAYIYGKGYENSKPSDEVPTVMLRADVDALPVQESENNLSGKKVCISKKPGVCHACGHDAHIAMTLAAAKILNDHKDELKGRVVLMFERGEEGPNNVVFLMRHIIETGLHIDTVYGTHIVSFLEKGKISLRKGPVMAGGVFFKVKLIGRGGHGSRPDAAANPIDCYVSIANKLNEFRMKHVDPFHAFTYAPTVVQSGSADNVIPGELLFGANVRLYEPEDGINFKKYFLEVLEHECSVYGCRYEIEYLVGPKMPVKCDAECVDIAVKTIGEAVGKERITSVEPWMACESICGCLAIWPGVFSFLGSMDMENGYGALHHSPEFDIIEDVMPLGAAAAAAYAYGFLENPAKSKKGWFDGSIADFYEASGYNDGVLALLREGKPYEISPDKR